MTELPPNDNDWLKVEDIRAQAYDKGGFLPRGLKRVTNDSDADVQVVGNWFASFPSEAAPPEDPDEGVYGAARFLLENATGLDVESPHGQKTPERFVRMLRELTTPEEYEFTTFPADGYDEMIVEERIPFVSLCNHHIIPFTGYAYVGYIPDEKMAGLSKLARVVKFFAASLQTQEQLTSQIAEALEDELAPKGVAVVLKAEHFCMTIRGVKAPGALTTTSKMTGVFADHSRTAKAEFMSIIGGR